MDSFSGCDWGRASNQKAVRMDFAGDREDKVDSFIEEILSCQFVVCLFVLFILVSFGSEISPEGKV